MATTNLGGILGMSGSYNANCKPQFMAVELSLPFIRQAVDALDVSSTTSGPLIIADYGTSHGMNSIYAMKTMIEYLRETKKEVKEVLVVHNDLPTNDWSSVFQLLLEDNSYNAVASGRSFYEQCLPNNSLSIGYSSSSLHWLSKKPCNFSNHCVFLFASNEEISLFKTQARLDYTQFLEHRSRELRPGGVLILNIACVNEQGKSGFENAKDLLYKCAQLLPLTSQELLDYTIPLYFRTQEECVDEELLAQCSLKKVKSEFCFIPSKMFEPWKQGQITTDEFARSRAQFLRSWSESALRQVLEKNNERSKEEVEQLLTQFWALYESQVKERPYEHDTHSYRIYLVLKKMPSP